MFLQEDSIRKTVSSHIWSAQIVKAAVILCVFVLCGCHSDKEMHKVGTAACD